MRNTHRVQLHVQPAGDELATDLSRDGRGLVMAPDGLAGAAVAALVDVLASAPGWSSARAAALLSSRAAARDLVCDVRGQVTRSGAGIQAVSSQRLAPQRASRPRRTGSTADTLTADGSPLGFPVPVEGAHPPGRRPLESSPRSLV